MDVTSHIKLARRAADYVQQGQHDAPATGKYDMPHWAGFIVAFTVVAYYFVFLKIRYTIGGVISTLAIVEEPARDILVGVENVDDDGMDKKSTDALLEPEVAIVKMKPLTAKICTAMVHLKARGGRHAAFRGFSLFVVYGFLKSLIVVLLSSSLPVHSAALAAIAAEVLLAKLQMVWVHHVISEPSSKSWFQRSRSLEVSWSKIAPAALVKAVAFQLTIGLPAALLCTYGPVHQMVHGHGEDLSPVEIKQGIAYLIGAGVAGLALLILVFVPAHVTFVRVAASMLPEEDNTLVAFDRTFGGRVDSADRIGLLAAWTTFTWEQRRRFMGLMAKVVAITVAVTLLFAMVLAAEVYMFTGLNISNFFTAGAH